MESYFSNESNNLKELGKSDFENFLEVQILKVLDDERKKKKNIRRIDELTIAIDFCKKFLIDSLTESTEQSDNKEGIIDSDSSTVANEQRKKEVLAKIVDLNLEIQAITELNDTDPKINKPLRKIRGHEFIAQSASGRNPYCEICLSTIWRLAQSWRRCNVCGFRAHEKCIDKVCRPCVSYRLARKASNESPLIFQICPESNLTAQNFQCAECLSSIAFDEGFELEARLCDYDGKYYCRRCHWNDEVVIPARIVCNWDAKRRPVCRASKQLLNALERKPLIDLHKENSSLFKYVHVLQKIRQLRKTILLMKCYFVNCKIAQSLRILQYLNRYQHFVDTDFMYTMEDLTMLWAGKLLTDIDTVVSVFRKHITIECEICRGNAFICELCDLKEEIYPFSDDVAICKTCSYVFHRACFERVSKRCSRCARRHKRKMAVIKPC